MKDSEEEFDFDRQASKIKFIGLDVDGTLTDGKVFFGAQGEALKVFNAKDGYGIRLCERAGIKVIFITGRKSSEGLLRRLEDWKLDPATRLFHSIEDKLSCASKYLAGQQSSLAEFAYMGDDTPDAELLAACGLGACPSDAHQSVLESVHFVSTFAGGDGAVREFLDAVLASKS